MLLSENELNDNKERRRHHDSAPIFIQNNKNCPEFSPSTDT